MPTSYWVTSVYSYPLDAEDEYEAATLAAFDGPPRDYDPVSVSVSDPVTKRVLLTEGS
jgi:hypothetical protein